MQSIATALEQANEIKKQEVQALVSANTLKARELTLMEARNTIESGKRYYNWNRGGARGSNRGGRGQNRGHGDMHENQYNY